MTKIKMILGLNPCEDWSDEDLDQYDEDASKERYADLCCEAIQAMNSDIEIEELYPYDHFPKILNWDEVDDFEDICQDVYEVCLTICSEYDEWQLEKI